MSNPTPQKIKIKVVSEWLQGLPRDKIARINSLGAGTISGIIQQIKYNDPDIDLMRYTSLNLRKNNKTLFEYAAAARIRNFLEKNGLNEDQVEELLEDIAVHCYRVDTPIEDFLLLIHKVADLADSFETPILEVSYKIDCLKAEEEEIEREIRSKRQQLNQILKEYNTTIEILKRYLTDRPTFERVKELEAINANQKRIIEIATKELNEFVAENEKLKSLLSEKENVLEDNFSPVNTK